MENLTVIIPFYNEENFLRKSIERVLSAKVADNLILVDDCSTDNSFDIATEIAKDLKFVKIIQSKKNLGKGNALNLAKKLIDTTHVVIHDADLEYFPSDFHKLLEKSNQYPDSIILGSRFIGNKARKNIYKRRKVKKKV